MKNGVAPYEFQFGIADCNDKNKADNDILW